MVHECRRFRLQTELISNHIGYLCRLVNDLRCNNLLLCGWLLHLDLHWLCRLQSRNCNRLNRRLLLLMDKPLLLFVLDGHLLLLDGLISHHLRLETHHLRHVVGELSVGSWILLVQYHRLGSRCWYWGAPLPWKLRRQWLLLGHDHQPSDMRRLLCDE